MRKTDVIVVPQEWGARDAGKHFLITEWPAERAEKWALRAIIAYNRGGGQVPEEAIGGGMEAIFWMGVNTFLRGQMKSEEVIPILDELLQCVQMIRDPSARGPDGKPVVSNIVSPDDVEEVRTRMWLRSEVIRVHTNFSPADVILRLISGIMSTEPTS